MLSLYFPQSSIDIIVRALTILIWILLSLSLYVCVYTMSSDWKGIIAFYNAHWFEPVNLALCTKCNYFGNVNLIDLHLGPQKSPSMWIEFGR